MHWEKYGTTFVILAKMYNFIPILRKHQTQIEEHCKKITVQYSSSQSHKKQGKTKTLLQTERDYGETETLLQAEQCRQRRNN